jgi:hypothetical protein
VEVGIVEVHGRLDAAGVAALVAELRRRTAELGGDVARVDAYRTRYETVTEEYTYDCSKTETTHETRTTSRPGPDGTTTLVRESVPVSRRVPQTCNGTRQVEVATMTLTGRAFRSKEPTP